MAQIDLTKGNISKTILRFAFPMICGNLLQQLYNVVDTLIVGQYLGRCSCSSWFFLYINDIFDFYFAWNVHGKWGGFFYSIWRKESEKTENGYVCFFFVDCDFCGCDKCSSISFY